MYSTCIRQSQSSSYCFRPVTVATEKIFFKLTACLLFVKGKGEGSSQSQTSKVRSELSKLHFRASEMDISYRLFKLEIDFFETPAYILKRLLIFDFDFSSGKLTSYFVCRL